jgi:hypothetical protein
MKARHVDWVSGAGFMARFDILRDVNFFTPDYFLYFEEVDLMRRINNAGWKVCYIPQARIRHIAGAATGLNRATLKRKRQPKYWYESWRLYFVKNHGSGYAAACVMTRLLGWMMNYVIRRAQLRQPDSPKRFLSDTIRHALLPILFSKSTL